MMVEGTMLKIFVYSHCTEKMQTRILQRVHSPMQVTLSVEEVGAICMDSLMKSFPMSGLWKQWDNPMDHVAILPGHL